MKHTLLLVVGLIFTTSIFAQKNVPDTVSTGIYITSIHDIDFKQKEYTIKFWLWLKYKNKDFDFLQNLEVPQAKSVDKSFSTIDTSNGRVYILMKLDCVMKDSWKINNFPFDRQKLRLSIENSQFDSKSLVFVADTLGKHFDPRFTLRGWTIDSFDISTGIKAYETTFGDESVDTPHTEYSTFKVKVGIKRDAMGLFWKMFLGMYVAFLIAYVCFYIHADGIDSRFGLSVGALFAVIGNKYIIDSSLPESVSFTLVDTLHGITLLFILLVVSATALSLKMVKKNKINQAHKFDITTAQILLFIYVALNMYFILQANG
ncbi:hypothetical protein LK994_04495 [Ferruginibacter lapsinanis]|uniref:hypothetical protein n=1 Tax=Ferruginibacter lapsinanis TaxID=563172 RepID=UPI001E3E1659|nr:hypothetical protein [Ferruginibacter lapsinanis]UEG50731.1 hypothetical protein LK994_04495 [Ferruginibacter lapsinanis]